MHGNDDSAVGAVARAAARLDQTLDRTVHTVGAHLGALYLHVPEQQTLQMTTVTGVPSRMARPWSRVAWAAPVPVAEAGRTGEPVWIPDQQDLARRFPRTALAFPYSVAMYVVPLMAGGVCWGVVLLLWPDTRPAELSATELARIGKAADQMAWLLEDSAYDGHPLSPRDEPLAVEPQERPDHPAVALTERLTEGFVALDLRGRMTFLNATAAELLGRDVAELLDAEPWDVLPWLNDPVHENAYLAALFSRMPTGFTARRPDGAWLSFLLYPDATGISLRIRPSGTPDGTEQSDDDSLPAAPARAGTLFHLLHLASALTEAVGVNEVAESLMSQMRPVLNAQGLSLMISDEGRLRVVGSRGFPQGMRQYFDGLPMASQTEGIRTMETGVPAFHPDTTELVRRFPQHKPYRDMASFAFLPLTVSGTTFGCLLLGYDKPRPFPADERAELTSLAGMIAQALERARLYDANAQVARGLQDGLLPRRLPRVPGLGVAARYRPATHALQVGGDFYDLIVSGDGTVGAVIGDVQGHSVQAAALMGQIRTAVHTHARVGTPPEEILASTNRLLLEMRSGMFCSCLYARLDVSRQRVLLASAGHPPPILRHPDHSTEVLNPSPGLLLGIEEDPGYEAIEVPLPPGSLLALYTDGLVERPGIDLGLAIDALADELARAGDEPLDALADSVVKRAEETVVPQSSDDIALLLLAPGRAAWRQGSGGGSGGGSG